MSAKPIVWHEECLKKEREAIEQLKVNTNCCEKRIRGAVASANEYAAQITRAKIEGRDAFDRERFKVKKHAQQFSPDITITETTAMQAGSCNACGRLTQTEANYSVRSVQLRSIAFRVCPSCAEALAFLLRGEIPGGKR